MAMDVCRDCGQSVSDEAKACPHCGARKPSKRKFEAEQRTRGIGCLLFLGLLLISALWEFVQWLNS